MYNSTQNRHCELLSGSIYRDFWTAPWRSGDAADCKSVYPGSIPGGASSNSIKSLFYYVFCQPSILFLLFAPTFEVNKMQRYAPWIFYKSRNRNVQIRLFILSIRIVTIKKWRSKPPLINERYKELDLKFEMVDPCLNVCAFPPRKMGAIFKWLRKKIILII